MVEKLKIGVIGIQGAIFEHISIMKKALIAENRKGLVKNIKNKEQIKEIDALIIPGGESSTISNILFVNGMYHIIKKRLEENNLPVMGTCAGCLILAEKIIDDNKDIKLLKAMNMDVMRNAFGRQKESFEQIINISIFDDPYNAIFIRAPIIKKVRGKCKSLAKIDGKIVMAKQDNLLALSFHPELTNDLRIHKYFIKNI